MPRLRGMAGHAGVFEVLATGALQVTWRLGRHPVAAAGQPVGRSAEAASARRIRVRHLRRCNARRAWSRGRWYGRSNARGHADEQPARSTVRVVRRDTRIQRHLGRGSSRLRHSAAGAARGHGRSGGDRGGGKPPPCTPQRKWAMRCSRCRWCASCPAPRIAVNCQRARRNSTAGVCFGKREASRTSLRRSLDEAGWHADGQLSCDAYWFSNLAWSRAITVCLEHGEAGAGRCRSSFHPPIATCRRDSGRRPGVGLRGPALWRPLRAQLGHRRLRRPAPHDRVLRGSGREHGIAESAACAVPGHAGACEPYSPSSRVFRISCIWMWKPLPILPNAARRRSWCAPAFQAQLRALRASEQVDYRGVAAS